MSGELYSGHAFLSGYHSLVCTGGCSVLKWLSPWYGMKVGITSKCVLFLQHNPINKMNRKKKNKTCLSCHIDPYLRDIRATVIHGSPSSSGQLVSLISQATLMMWLGVWTLINQSEFTLVTASCSVYWVAYHLPANGGTNTISQITYCVCDVVNSPRKCQWGGPFIIAKPPYSSRVSTVDPPLFFFFFNFTFPWSSEPCWPIYHFPAICLHQRIDSSINPLCSLYTHTHTHTHTHIIHTW